MTAAQCPLCDWSTPVPSAPPIAPRLADALGMSVLGMSAVAAHQSALRLEHELRGHLREHEPEEWVPALMEARRKTQRADDLVAELRRHVASLERLTSKAGAR